MKLKKELIFKATKKMSSSVFFTLFLFLTSHLIAYSIHSLQSTSSSSFSSIMISTCDPLDDRLIIILLRALCACIMCPTWTLKNIHTSINIFVYTYPIPFFLSFTCNFLLRLLLYFLLYFSLLPGQTLGLHLPSFLLFTLFDFFLCWVLVSMVKSVYISHHLHTIHILSAYLVVYGLGVNSLHFHDTKHCVCYACMYVIDSQSLQPLYQTLQYLPYSFLSPILYSSSTLFLCSE